MNTFKPSQILLKKHTEKHAFSIVKHKRQMFYIKAIFYKKKKSLTTYTD